MIQMSKRGVLRAAAMSCALAPFGAQAAMQVSAPDAGAILQQLRPPVAPPPPSAQPSLQVQSESASSPPASAPFEVKALRITGNTAFPTPVLHALVADQEGRSLTLLQLEALAARITAYYRDHGFPLSRAIVPAQSIADGTVEIRVLEARYGAVRLNNSSAVRDPVLAATLAPLHAGEPITGSELDRTLLLLSDIPGVAVNAVLKPGAEVGTSDLDATITRRTVPVATATVDNFGNRYIGRARFSGTLGLLNPLHQGDSLDLGVLTTGRGMQYGRASYEALLTGAGTRLGAAFSALHYKLGREVRSLDANGTAQVASAWIRQPLVRSKSINIRAQLEYDHKRLRDRIDATDTRTDRHLDNGVASIDGDARDSFLGGGLTAWSLAWTFGHTGFDDADARAVDALTARTSGAYSKWNLGVSRLQGLGSRDAFYLSFSAQLTNANLDSAEKLSVGGPYTVRAYDLGAVSADSGYVATAELRHDLGQVVAGLWQAVAFVDTAHVTLNHRSWTNTANEATLSGAGAGLTWYGPGLWHASATVSKRLGGPPAAIGPQGSTRAWATLSKAF